MKHKKYPKFEDYDFSGYEEITGDALYRINGGGRIDNTNEAVAGISTTSASVGISLGRFSSKENAAGAYISYGASGGLSGVSVGYDYITNMDGDYVGNIESLGFGFGAAYAEGHARVGATGILSLKKE